MGGLRKLMPLTYWFFLAGALALVGIPPFAGFFSKDSILAATLARGTFGAILWVVGDGRHVPDRPLHVPHALPRLLGRAERLRARAPPPARRQGGRRPRCSGRSPCSPCSSLVGGWIQVAPLWTPISNFLEVSAPPLVEASGTQEVVSSVFAVAFGLVGIGVAWAIYGARRAEVPRVPRVQRRSSTSSGSTSCTTRAFYKPAVWLARALEPLDRAADDPRLGDRARASARRSRAALVGRVQTGLLRAYALALAGGLAVLVVVFISVR